MGAVWDPIKNFFKGLGKDVVNVLIKIAITIAIIVGLLIVVGGVRRGYYEESIRRDSALAARDSARARIMLAQKGYRVTDTLGEARKPTV